MVPEDNSWEYWFRNFIEHEKDEDHAMKVHEDVKCVRV